MITIRGKKALVTGAASGIGRSISLALADEGADLFLLDIEEGSMKPLAEQIAAKGVMVFFRKCDVSDFNQVRECFRFIMEKWGHLDILVNNAGIAWYGPTDQMEADQWDRLLEVNLLGPVRLIHLALPVFRKRPEAHILNVCSLAGLIPAKKMAAYQTSKFGLVGTSLSLRSEYGARGIGVTALCPGFVESDMLSGGADRSFALSSRYSLKWLSVSPDFIAAQAISAIKKNKGLVVPSVKARWVWYFFRLFPNLFDSLRVFKHRKRLQHRFKK